MYMIKLFATLFIIIGIEFLLLSIKYKLNNYFKLNKIIGLSFLSLGFFFLLLLIII